MTELNLHFWCGFVVGMLVTLAILEFSIYLANRRIKRIERFKQKFNADYIVGERERKEREAKRI